MTINQGLAFRKSRSKSSACCLMIWAYRREWDDKKGMFKEKPWHDWTSHAADVHSLCGRSGRPNEEPDVHVRPAQRVKPPEFGPSRVTRST